MKRRISQSPAKVRWLLRRMWRQDMADATRKRVVDEHQQYSIV